MAQDTSVDVAIIGAGTAGLSAYSEVRKATDNFVLINGGPYGTTGARVGCMPSKILIQVAHDFHRRHVFATEGIEGSAGLRINIPQGRTRNRERLVHRMDRNDYTAANRLAWNEAAPIHKKLKFEQLIESVRQPGYSCLDGIETAQFHEIGLANKAVAQIGCNNGRELLGYVEEEGLDYYGMTKRLSENSVLGAARLQAPCPALPCIAGSLRIRLLRAPWAGRFRSGFDLRVNFQTISKYKSAPMYSFPHKRSDIITACLNTGLELVSFTEYAHDITNLWVHFERFSVKPPMCYTLVARARG